MSWRPYDPTAMAMMSQNIVKLVNVIPKLGYDHHSDRGLGHAKHSTRQEARGVDQV